jgi:hypothetical protein
MRRYSVLDVILAAIGGAEIAAGITGAAAASTAAIACGSFFVGVALIPWPSKA